MTEQELVKQWLQPGAIVPVDANTTRILITALRERLAQPEQEPVCAHGVGKTKCDFCKQPEQCKYPDCKCATENPCLKGMAQPQRTHWEGCEEVHPECKKPEQEPVAHTLNCVCGAVWDVSPDGVEEMVHAPNPPQRKPLTDEEALELWNKHEKHWRFENNALAFTRAIEAAHGIKEQS